ncbi:amidohydrolase [Aeromicrobium sp.]|uniref:amidohydrolase n=1 Tax=Aeromicrobium sp. TaxID=1871063 RepID=UPI00198F9B03|nr:amidohydrolase [Aeromicrobium sp.]MBC7630221.1 amidohydrolase [Aeromicrobium sp.]
MSLRISSSDLLLTNAHFYVDGRGAAGVESMAVRGGVIAGLGPVSRMSDLIDASAQTVDLGGRWVLPGFHDAHVHPVQAGLEVSSCDLSGGERAADYLDIIETYSLANPDDAWILGGGWSMEAFPRGLPTAAALDRVVGDRLVFLPNRDHHSAWVSTAALRLAGISASTADPADGRIERDVDGEPTGALHEGAMELVRSLIPDSLPAQLESALLTAQARLHAFGITGWQDALVGEGLGLADSLDTYLSVKGSERLTAKVVGALWWDRARGAEQIEELLERRTRAASAGFDAGSVKIMQDGVCETCTASVIDAYLDRHGEPTDNHGLSFIEAGDLARYVQLLDAHDFQVHVHALGDRAVRDSLDAVEHAITVNGRRGNRHHLAHIQIVHPDDVSRFAELDVTANAQPLWACHDEQMVGLTLPFLSGPARGQQYVFGSLLRSGGRLAFGSDWPVSSPDPLLGIHVAVNRTEPGGTYEPLLAEQGLTVVEAIDAYTSGSAWVSRRDTTTGTIAVGKAADLAVIDADILAMDSSQIASARVAQTWVDGVKVFDRN